MNILITGKSGFIGSPLFQMLESKGYCVKFLQRVDKITGAFQWVTETGEMSLGEFDPDVFIHLASESVSNQRWSKQKYKKIVDSRLSHTEKLVLSLKKITQTKPSKQRQFICASGVSIYNDSEKIETDNQTLESKSGDEFKWTGEFLMQNICFKREAIAKSLEADGWQVTCLRLGTVYDVSSGALAKMIDLTKKGKSGILGDGNQFISWISREDAINAILFIIEKPLIGFVNLTSPHPVKNVDLTHKLASSLKKNANFKKPKWLLRLIFGKMADEFILRNLYITPERLISHGFEFKHPSIDSLIEEIEN